MSLRVDNSPFDSQQVELLNRLLATLSPDQTTWLGGYLAGIRQALEASVPAAADTAIGGTAREPQAAAGALEVTILYGSQTGNAMRLARKMARRLEKRGFAAALSCMSEYKPRHIKKARHVLVIVSTHGEGDPPDKALPFYEFLHGRRVPRLEGTRFAVLALGDLTYKHFCKTGKDFDRRLEELGAERLHPRADCDVDYDEAAEAWMEGVLAALCRRAEAEGGAPRPGAARRAGAAAASLDDESEPAWTRSRPFSAEVLENLNLNGRGSDKETRLLKLSLEDSGLSFEPGDSLGIYPENRPDLVDQLIREMRWDGDQPVPAGKAERPLRDALLKHYEITALTRPLVEQAAAFSRDGLKDMLAGPEEQVDAYLSGRDLLDLVRDFSLAGAPAAEFVPVLRKMPARLYSIASSHRANPDEVDLIIVALRYEAHGRQRYGTCSVYCSERLGEGDRVPVYVHSNPNFRPPPDPDTPVIMVGPGTGVAPFRAFLEEREETGARGRTWLFFGDRRFRTDFLCQTEWLRWVKSGVLGRMDVAFSRDASEKVYVQHRMLEQSREIYAWLQEGAYFYVCGDEKRMAPDVHAALTTIVGREGGLGPEAAAEYVARLQREGRYQRDVY
jgi:sulfite reductase (NADPH) flavoprotein alpha-component